MSRFQTIRKVPIRKRCHYATAPLAPVPGVGTLCPSPTHGLQMSFKDKSTLELIALRADIDAAIAVIEREKALRASAKAKQATKPKPPRTPKPKRAPEQKTPERPKRLTLKPRADVDATAKPDSANQTVAALETLEPAAETPHATMQPVQPALDSTHAPVKFMHPPIAPWCGMAWVSSRCG